MKPATRFALSIAALLLGIVIVAAAAVIISQGQVARSQQRWCDTLQLLTSTPITPPADPRANPSREGEYRLYLDFLTLRKVFGCKLSRTA